MLRSIVQYNIKSSYTYGFATLVKGNYTNLDRILRRPDGTNSTNYSAFLNSKDFITIDTARKFYIDIIYTE
jgi:hypothetical protein